MIWISTEAKHVNTTPVLGASSGNEISKG